MTANLDCGLADEPLAQVTINQLVNMAMELAGTRLTVKHVSGPTGVRGRNSDNRLIKEKLGWVPSKPLVDGLEKTYQWIHEQVVKVRVEA